MSRHSRCVREIKIPLITSGLLFWLLMCNVSFAANQIEIGRRLYEDGLRENGEPLSALVAGDVEILGTQFSCRNCHGISGMGSKEGDIIVPAIPGSILFEAAVQPKRAAYDRKSLGRVLREGVTPSARMLDRLMPRFRLTDNEVKSLYAYLTTLTTNASAGVTSSQIRFATVIEKNAEARGAVLSVWRKFVADKARQTRLESERWDRGTTPDSQLPTVYREWVLDIWEVSGAPDEQLRQLQLHYEREPVFALLGGLLPNSSQAYAQFCEAQRIPCLLPSVLYPHANDSDSYTLNFSAGLGLEAALAAKHIAQQPFKQLIQLYCGEPSQRAADKLVEILKQQGIGFQTAEFDCTNKTAFAQARELAKKSNATTVLWLAPQQLSNLKSFNGERIYYSSTLLEGDFSAIIDAGNALPFVLHPFKLPNTSDSAYRRFKVWATLRKIPISHPRLQSEAFFAALMTKDIVGHLDRFFVRDYVLDLLDHAQGMAPYLAFYSRPTFGPGQRNLTKGGYVLPIVNDKVITDGANWVAP